MESFVTRGGRRSSNRIRSNIICFTCKKVSSNKVHSQIPSQFLHLKATQYDWGYRAEPSDQYCRALTNGCYWPRGKMIGGSGAIGSMIYLRGFPDDYNQWAEQENVDWDYETVLHYFKRSENNTDINELDRDYHNTNGPMKIGSIQNTETVSNVFLEAAKEFNYDHVQDFNADDRVGYSFVQGTIHNGVRQSAAKAYLTSLIAKRSNLHVIKEAHVLKLVFNKEGAVTGVRFNYNSTKEYLALATKEVILSAGTINTPQILMLSGIGMSSELVKLRIKPRKDLRVGKNLQDHGMVMLFFRFNETLQISLPTDNHINLFNYLYTKSGPLAHPTHNLIGYVNTRYWIDNHPDLQFSHHMYPRDSDQVEKVLSSLGLRDQYVRQLVQINKESPIGIVFAMLTNPRSRGEILLRNNNPVYKPKIVPNYFAEKEDVESLINGIQFYEKFVNTTTFQRFGGELIRFSISEECDKQQYMSAQYCQCYMRHFSSSLYHPVGTAKMGSKADSDAVVDYRLRVHGVTGLRIADASIMPSITSGHTDAPAIMIGERVVDFIKDDWN